MSETESPKPLRLLVVDDHEVVRQGLVSLLDRRDGGRSGADDVERATLFAELAITALDVEPELATHLGSASPRDLG